MRDLLRDTRVQRLLAANTLGAIGSGLTIFAVPWLIVNQPGGNAAFLWTTIATTLMLFLIAPYWGAWVDRHSRKTALLGSEAWGFCAMLTMGCTGLMGGFSLWHLALTYLAGMIYYTLHFSPKFAMVQQMFDRSQYQSLTALMEIQGQTAMMIAGGLGGLLVEHVPLWSILLFDAGTYLASFLLLSTIPYKASHLNAADNASKTSIWGSVAVGWHWLSARPKLALFFTCALLPFLIVMASNYLFPIYVAQTLQLSARWFAGGEIAFALGAICAGFTLPKLIGRHSAASTIPITMLIFFAGLLILILLPLPIPFLIAGLCLGFGNAGCRVARSSLMLHVIPNEVMGRVNGFYIVFDRLMRTLLVFSMKIIDTYGPPSGYLLLSFVFLIAFAGVLFSRSAIRPAVAGT